MTRNPTRLTAVMRVVGIAALSLPLLASCKTIDGQAGAGVGPVPPESGDEPPPDAPIGDNEDAIDAYKRKLGELKLKRESAMSTEEGDQVDRCEQLCWLMSETCQTKKKLCDLADRYPAQDSFQAACREAQQECREAETSCIECTADQQGDCAAPRTGEMIFGRPGEPVFAE